MAGMKPRISSMSGANRGRSRSSRCTTLSYVTVSFVMTTAPGRPRDRRIDRAVLAATADLLVDVGYADLTVAAVAERARTTKPAIYRRWRSKAHLVHEAAFPAVGDRVHVPDS